MQPIDSIVFSLFLIFVSAALLSTLALYTRQSLLVVYIILGAILGPWGLKLISNNEIIKQTGDVGIIFLLFLLGLHLQPQRLWNVLRKTTLVTVWSSLLFALIGCAIARVTGFGEVESMIVGISMMFSSTIIGLTLLPTVTLRHRHTGEIMISILLLQDWLAIFVLLIIHSLSNGKTSVTHWLVVIISLPVLVGVAYFMQRFILTKLIRRFEKIEEYTFLLAIAWCLGMAQLSGYLGLSEGIGAFIAGISVAANPIAEYIAKKLEPVKDFFLVLFFFSIGAQFNFIYFKQILVPVIILSVVMLTCKPVVFRFLLRQVSEGTHIAWEIGTRLGQASEFSLLVAYLAFNAHFIAAPASYLIQATTLITFIVSSYLVDWRYRTPVMIAEQLQKEEGE